MATLWISEFSGMPVVSGTRIQAPSMPPIAEQAVTFSGATDAAPFTSTTRFVRVFSSSAAHVNLAGAATTSKMPLAANAAEYLAVTPGATLSVIAGV